MKPNFALTLSFDGIGLLHRVPSGWHLVGEVGLSSDDLAGELAVLRRTAQRLDSSGLSCKLVIPNEQIRYLTIDTPDEDDAARAQAASDAMDGATPYAVDELRIDWAADGERTHVAAVAQETLQEAEDFALEHQFGPVSFVAIPPDGAFVGEVFFGACSQVKDPVERDLDPIHIVGMAHLPAAGEPLFDTAKPPQDASDAPTIPPAPNAKATPEQSADQETPDKPAKSEAPAKKTAPKTPATGKPKTDKPKSDKPKTGKKPVTAERKADAPKAPAAPMPAFSSRRQAPSDDAGKSIDPAAMARTLVAKAAPRLTFGLRSGAGKKTAPKPSTKRSAPKPASPPPPRVPAAPKEAAAPAPKPDKTPTPAPPAGRAASEQFKGAARSLRGRTANAGSSTLSALTQPFRAAGATARRGASQSRQAARTGADRIKAGLSQAGQLVKRREKTPAPIKSDQASQAPLRSPAPRQTPQDEEQKMTIFGARAADSPGRAAIGGQTRNIGLILASAVLLALAGVGVWATIYSGNDTMGLFGERADVQDLPRASDDIAALSPPQGDAGATVQPPAPLEPAEAPETPPADTAPPPAAPQDEAEPGQTGEATDAAPQQTTSLIPRPDEAAARYAATGIWPAAPDAPEAPPVDPLGNLYLASLDRNVDFSDAVALPPADVLQADPSPRPQTAPALPGTRFDLDERGLVTATPEGTISPDGVMIYAGAPPVQPPRLRTSDTRVQDALRERLSGVRPKARPAGLVDGAAGEGEQSGLDAEDDTALAVIHPKRRPADIAAKARANAQANTANTANATAQAIDVSLKPEVRPDDLEPEVARRTASTVAPDIPTSSSVAKQATVKNALSMRKISLIGVYGKPSSRRALVRLGNGRFKKVQIGDSIDGGRVAAIGETELRYIKGGRNLVLEMPNG
ncbi:MAG: hypothetical protein FH759_05155 [Sediminimonas qiaohouensis]|uniref:Type IV pilus biogenesis protein PilP n=1 Tax=Sediminimonas qiaohouensis TaxID=552061 RepID=A0A7C9HA77_9RHOB|nr:hypothetical protein [Sediminimonas qiaohouensis]MTJ04069.1 hypothetical protein [Sediminimonas qiaohouensis]